MSLIPTKLAEFDNGMTTDLRNGNPSMSAIVSHFDNYTIPTKLTPHRSMELDATVESTLDEFQITKILNTTSGIYGFGAVSSIDSHACIYTKNTPTDPATGWTLAFAGTSASGGTRNDLLFILYRNYLYGGNNGGIWKYGDITGIAAFTYNEYTTHPATGQGLVVGDILYVPSGNLLLQNDQLTGAGWSVGLTLDTNLTIKSLAEMPGGNIAIGCDRADGTSITYLWNRDTTQQPYDRIPWGFGTIKHIENLGGSLVGISITSMTTTSLTPQVHFKQWTGSRLVTFARFNCTLATFTGDKQKFNDLFYFLAEITLNGSALKGLWKIFEKPNGQLVVSFDRLPRNDTALDAGGLKGFQRIGDYVFISHLIPTTGKYTVWRTNDQAIYSATSVFETIIFNSVLGLRNKHIPDSSQYKDFVGATPTTEALPSGASIVLKYKIDADSSWTTFLTHNTLSSLSTSINQLAAQIGQHKELKLRIESTGGAELTGLDLLQDVTDKKPY